MSARKKSLSSTLLCGPKDSKVEVEIGKELYLIAPETIYHPIQRTLHQNVMRDILKNLGNPPYELQKIYSIGVKIFFDIKNEKGCLQGIAKNHFGAYLF